MEKNFLSPKTRYLFLSIKVYLYSPMCVASKMHTQYRWKAGTLLRYRIFRNLCQYDNKIWRVQLREKKKSLKDRNKIARKNLLYYFWHYEKMKRNLRVKIDRSSYMIPLHIKLFIIDIVRSVSNQRTTLYTRENLFKWLYKKLSKFTWLKTWLNTWLKTW